MNYQIITDEVKLDQFIDWLPDTKDSEVYYLQLFSRKKYTDVKIRSGSDSSSIKRFVCKKDRIKDKIRQLEVPIGYYKQRDVELPQECLALYITPNPRCNEKAAKQLLKVLADKITRPYEYYNTYQLALTEIHKAVGTKYFIDFDFDNIEFESVKDKILSFVNKEAINPIKTRGGFHLLIYIPAIEKEYSKTWYSNILSLGPDVKGDVLLPCVGCCQGNFTPYFINHYD